MFALAETFIRWWVRRRLSKPVLVSCLVISAGACSQPPNLVRLSGPAQGTTWHVTFWSPDGKDVEAIRQAIVSELDRLDAMLSTYRPDSALERFNRSKQTGPVKVDPEIVKLVDAAREVSVASRGCYDLTIKPLFDLWGFSSNAPAVLDASAIDKLRKQTGFTLLETASPTELRKAVPDLQVDLSSIAQGYSVGQVANVMESAGVRNYLVEIGGEMKTRGHKPDGTSWTIAIEKPVAGDRAIEKVLTISRDAPMSVMTSGTYRHYFDDQGKRYSHVLDARTGRPVTHTTVSVTVLDDNPTKADAWSTALLCLGDEEGVTAANQAGIAALFIKENDDHFVEKTTSAWRSMKNIEVQ